MVTGMIKRTGKIIFLSLVFLFGVVIGGVKTPEIIGYAKAMDNADKVEKQKKTKSLPEKLRKSKRIV